MICINTGILRSIDSTIRFSATESGHGLHFSDLFSFGAGNSYGRAAVEALESDPDPRTLLLIGMGDRYDAGSKLGATVTEIASTNDWWRTPTAEEASIVCMALETCTHPRAAEIAALFSRYR